MDRATLAAVALFIVSTLFSITILYSHSTYFIYNDTTFTYNTVPIVLTRPTTITTAWVRGNVIISPPLITINSNTYTFTEIHLSTRGAYMGQITEKPTRVVIFGAHFKRFIPINSEVLSVIFTVIITFFLLVYIEKLKKEDRKKVLLSAYLLIITASFLAATHVEVIGHPIPLQGTEYLYINSTTISKVYVMHAKIPPGLATTTFFATCAHDTIPPRLSKDTMIFTLPISCSELYIASTRVTLHHIPAVNLYLALAILALNTFIFSIIMLFYEVFMEEI